MYFIDSAKMIKKQKVLTEDLKFLAVRINLILNGHVFFNCKHQQITYVLR